MKWLLINKFANNKVEVLSLLFMAAVATMFLSSVWRASIRSDGTSVDLSETHQLELIEELRRDEARKRLLLERQRRLDRVGDCQCYC